MNNISKNIKYIYKKIHTTAYDINRNPNDIKLIVVTKNQTIDSIKIAVSLKQNNFGENYAQEAFKKIQWFRKHTTDNLVWHFIGIMQSNKSRIIAENFDWCHTLTSPKLVYKLNSQRPKTMDYLNVLIQININNDKSRSGVYTIDNMLNLAKIINHCPNLKLRGIMSMSIPPKNFEKQLLQFKQAYIFFQQLKIRYTYVDTLSLGMSDDIIAAIHAGSNLLRIGTAIFGSR